MSKTILLVDDDLLILAAVRRALGHHGVRVLTASSGAEAIQHFNDMIPPASVDVIFVDINLGGESGAKVAADLLRIAPTVEIVFMSAHSKETLVEHGVFLDNARFVSKPITLDEIERVLARV